MLLWTDPWSSRECAHDARNQLTCTRHNERRTDGVFPFEVIAAWRKPEATRSWRNFGFKETNISKIRSLIRPSASSVKLSARMIKGGRGGTVGLNGGKKVIFYKAGLKRRIWGWDEWEKERSHLSEDLLKEEWRNSEDLSPLHYQWERKKDKKKERPKKIEECVYKTSIKKPIDAGCVKAMKENKDSAE